MNKIHIIWVSKLPELSICNCISGVSLSKSRQKLPSTWWNKSHVRFPPKSVSHLRTQYFKITFQRGCRILWSEGGGGKWGFLASLKKLIMPFLTPATPRAPSRTASSRKTLRGKGDFRRPLLSNEAGVRYPPVFYLPLILRRLSTRCRDVGFKALVQGYTGRIFSTLAPFHLAASSFLSNGLR